MKNKSKIIKIYIIPYAIVVASLLLGLIFKSDLFGISTLICGSLSAYYMAIGKWYCYIFGMLHSIFYAYNGAINGLFGILIFTVLFYVPLNIFGLVNWFKNKEPDHVKMKCMSAKTTVLLCCVVVSTSLCLGILLSLVPSEQLAFLDSTSQIINLCGVVLGTLRYREAWFIWICNNIIDLAIWIINIINHSANAEMMLSTVVAFFILNIIGLINWIKTQKRENTNQQNWITIKKPNLLFGFFIFLSLFVCVIFFKWYIIKAVNN